MNQVSLAASMPEAEDRVSLGSPARSGESSAHIEECDGHWHLVATNMACGSDAILSLSIDARKDTPSSSGTCEPGACRCLGILSVAGANDRSA
jgi:hypothetical protein